MVNSAKLAAQSEDIPLVAHLVYSFGCGGLQTLLAECINRLPAQDYRHVVICLTGTPADAGPVSRPGATFHYLNKPPGNGLATHLKFWRLMRRLRPAILHTYNIGTLEYNATAMLAGVPVRIHAEHGRDSVEIDGKHRTYNLLRRLLIPVIDAYVPVSDDLNHWLRETIRVPKRKIAQVINGVDTDRYAPSDQNTAEMPRPFWIGTVGRADRIKNHAGLVEVFERLLQRFASPQFDLRLAIVGDGPLLDTLRTQVDTKGWTDKVYLPGARTDVAEIMRSFSVFVLPSLSEATPVVILEAMATALPVVASRVGGVPQLVLDQQTGILVDPHDLEGFADAIAMYILDPSLGEAHGAAGRNHIQARYSVDAMVAGYADLYRRHLIRKRKHQVIESLSAPIKD
jgi:sugar transferase (PEP-CTERM/EpsH1 system associated)